MSVCAISKPPKFASEIDHLSFSSIKTYQACPRKFAFKYVEKQPGEFTPSCFSFGGAFHRAVERIHESAIAGGPHPELGDLMDAFDRAWSELTAERPQIKFSKDEDAGSLRQLAARMLSAYLEHYREHSLTSAGHGFADHRHRRERPVSSAGRCAADRNAPGPTGTQRRRPDRVRLEDHEVALRRRKARRWSTSTDPLRPRIDAAVARTGCDSHRPTLRRRHQSQESRRSGDATDCHASRCGPVETIRRRDLVGRTDRRFSAARKLGVQTMPVQKQMPRMLNVLNWGIRHSIELNREGVLPF